MYDKILQTVHTLWNAKLANKFPTVGVS